MDRAEPEHHTLVRMVNKKEYECTNILSLWLFWRLIRLTLSWSYLFNIWREVSFMTKQASMNNAYHSKSCFGKQWKTVHRAIQFTISAVILPYEKLGVCVVSTVNMKVGDEAQKAPVSQLHMRTEYIIWQLSTQHASISRMASKIPLICIISTSKHQSCVWWQNLQTATISRTLTLSFCLMWDTINNKCSCRDEWTESTTFNGSQQSKPPLCYLCISNNGYNDNTNTHHHHKLIITQHSKTLFTVPHCHSAWVYDVPAIPSPLN